MKKSINEEIVHQFLGTSRIHHRIFESKVMKFGIHRSQHRILMYLSKCEGKTVVQKDLARAFDISPAAIAVSIKKLADEGFIERCTKHTDNRYNVITLTERGWDIVNKTKDIISHIDNAMFEGFSEKELMTFSELLTKMTDNLKNIEETDNGEESGGQR